MKKFFGNKKKTSSQSLAEIAGLTVYGDGQPVPMEAIDREFAASLDRGVGDQLVLLSALDELPEGAPEGWEVFLNSDPDARVAAALELWGPLLANMTYTRQFLEGRLLDVRLIRIGDSQAGLAYCVITHETNVLMVFLGYDPRFNQGYSKFSDAVPEPLRRFTGNVHSGVGTADVPVAEFPTLPSFANLISDYEVGVVDTPEYAESGFSVPLDRILMVHASGGGAYVCVSPDLPGKGIFWRSDAPPIVEDFWTLYDLAVLAIFA